MLNQFYGLLDTAFPISGMPNPTQIALVCERTNAQSELVLVRIADSHLPDPVGCDWLGEDVWC